MSALLHARGGLVSPLATTAVVHDVCCHHCDVWRHHVASNSQNFDALVGSRSLLGSWMNFILTFFAYDPMQELMVIMFGPNGFMIANGFMQSPFWFVLEGVMLGILIDYVATKYGGEGPKSAVE
jgi:hypothetical protein